jgi:hypothetical protein
VSGHVWEVIERTAGVLIVGGGVLAAMALVVIVIIYSTKSWN